MQLTAPTHSNYRATIAAPVTLDVARSAIFDEMHVWWTHRVDRQPDGVTVRFNNSHARFAFAAEDPLIWTCTDANMLIEGVADAHEWEGTRLLWIITPTDAGCDITLEHEGLNAAIACHDVCTRGWQRFFEHSLLAHLSGQTPSPETN